MVKTFGLIGLGLFLSTQAMSQSLPPKAPPAEKPQYRFTSVLNSPTQVLLSLSRSNLGGVTDSIQKIWELNKANPASPIQIRVFAPESFEALADKQKSAVPGAIAKLKKDLSKFDKTLASQLAVHQYPYLQYPQISELGEPHFVKATAQSNWELGFLDLNPGNRSFLSLPAKKWPVLSKAVYKSELPLEEPQFIRESLKNVMKWKLTQLPVVPQGMEFESPGNRGANLILLPNSFSLVGDSAPVEMQKQIESLTGKAPLVIPTGFLLTRDIQQIFNLLPAKNSCGFVITKAELMWGLQLRKNDSYKDESLEEALFFFRKQNVKPTDTAEISQFELGREGRRYPDSGESANFAGEIRFYDDIVVKNMRAQRRIEAAKDQIAKFLVDQKICSKPEFLPIPAVPQIIEAQDYFDSIGEGSDEEKINLASNPLRTVVLGEHLLVSDFSSAPEKYRTTLKDATLRQLLKRGFPESQMHLVRASTDNDESYGFAGSTIVVRDLKESK